MLEIVQLSWEVGLVSFGSSYSLNAIKKPELHFLFTTSLQPISKYSKKDRSKLIKDEKREGQTEGCDVMNLRASRILLETINRQEAGADAYYGVLENKSNGCMKIE